jgi:hypothetical protein
MAQAFWDAKRPLVSARGPFGSQGFSPAGLTLADSTGVYTGKSRAFVLGREGGRALFDEDAYYTKVNAFALGFP